MTSLHYRPSPRSARRLVLFLRRCGLTLLATALIIALCGVIADPRHHGLVTRPGDSPMCHQAPSLAIRVWFPSGDPPLGGEQGATGSPPGCLLAGCRARRLSCPILGQKG